MQHRSIAIAVLSTAAGIAVVQATDAISAFRVTRGSVASVEAPAGSLKATVDGVLSTPDGPVVLLKPRASELVLPIWIGRAEARAIERARTNVVTPRPMTHDLFTDTLAALDAKLVHVRVDRLRPDGVYTGTLTFIEDGVVKTVDARPSDAMALALRTGAPIFVADTLQTQFIRAAYD